MTLAAVTLSALALLASSAAAEGPPLTVPKATLAKSLTCGPGVEHATSDPVLLTPAFSTADASYGWNYLPQLEADGIPHCWISVADEGYGDLQATAESVVYAVRRMRAMSGRKVVLLGHQHGALDELWALTFWPDVARSVSDLVSLETPYHGTSASTSVCGEKGEGGNCEPATRQITTGSRFVGALEAAPLPPGVAITSISSTDDVLITPQPAASHREGARNIVLQDVCPGRVVDHFAALADAVAYRLFLDARAHDGPADPARLPEGACAEQYEPKSDPAVLGLTSVFLAGFAARNEASKEAHEPATRAYAQRRPPVLKLPRRSRVRRSGRVALRLTCTSVGATACRARVRLAHGGHRTVALRSGRPTVTVLRTHRHHRVLLRVRATDALGNTAAAHRRVTLRRLQPSAKRTRPPNVPA